MAVDRTDYCRGCDSACCRYFTVPLDKPRDRDDFDALYWYIMHQGVSIFVDDDGDWYVNVDNTCRALGDDNLCRIHGDRPHVCRDHTAEVCERNDQDYGFRHHFRTPDELLDYARRHLARRKAARRVRAAPVAGRPSAPDLRSAGKE